MKRIVGYLLTMAILLTSTMSLVACGKKAEYSRVTMEMNPSVEFIIDKQDKIVSVTALNDDGATLITGETFVGKDIKEGAKLLLSLAVDTGFLVKGDVEMGENTLSISVSGSKSQSKKIYEKVLDASYKYLKNVGVDTYIERVNAWGKAALQTAVAENSIFTQQEIADMSEEQLYSALAASRIESAQLLTEELRTAYFTAKKHEISLTESNAVLTLIEQTDDLFGVAHIAYIQAVNAFSSAIKTLDNLRYEQFVAPNSNYQTSLVNLRAKKDELIAAKRAAAAILEESDLKAQADLAVIQAENTFNAALNLFTTVKESANNALETLISTLTAAEQALIAVEKTFPESICQTLKDGAGQIEKAINDKKSAFFAAFENAHAADIQAVITAMQTRKKSLIATAKGENA